MFNFDYTTKEDIKARNPNWSEVIDHPYRILIIEGSSSERTNVLLNLINQEPSIDKIYDKKPYEAKNKLLIHKTESTGLKFLSDSKAFIAYLKDMGAIYKNVEEKYK